MAVDASQLHRISPGEYRRFVEAGVFDKDARVELIDGLLVDMSPKTRAHENAVAWLNERLVVAIHREQFEVRIAAPLTIGNSEPEPDVAVVERPGAAERPSMTVLVVEVAVSSATRAREAAHLRAPVWSTTGWSTSTPGASSRMPIPWRGCTRTRRPSSRTACCTLPGSGFRSPVDELLAASAR